MKRFTLTLGFVAVALTACSTPEQVHVCATDTETPVVRPMSACDVGEPGVRLFSAPASQIDSDDVPIVNQELDSDFYVFSSPSSYGGSRATSARAGAARPSVAPPRAPAPVAKPAPAPRAVAPAPAARPASPPARTGR